MTVAVPDFGSLAQQQNQANNQATNMTNAANRPTQSNRLGTTTWQQDGQGNWYNNTQLDPWANDLFGRTMAGQQNLSSQIGAGLSQDGLMSFGGDPRAGLMGFGATDLTSNLGAMPQVGQYNQEVINAWNALQNPALDKAEAAQRQRLAAQGITNGSAISSISDRNLGANRTDAGNKAILAGYTQGNTEYNQALAGRAQRYGENLGQSQNQTAQRNQQYGENLGWSNMQNAQRAAQFGERSTAYNAALQGNSNLTGVRDSLDPNKWNTKVPAAAAYIPQTIYGAAQDTFNANRMNENADIAKSQAKTDSAINALRAAGGTSGIGGILSGAGTAWNAISPAVSSAWNWLTSPSGNNNNYIRPEDWE